MIPSPFVFPCYQGPKRVLCVLLVGWAFSSVCDAWSPMHNNPLGTRNGQARRSGKAHWCFHPTRHGAAVDNNSNEREDTVSPKGVYSNALDSNSWVHRRKVLDVAVASVGLAIVSPSSARADVTNKVASSTALRSLVRAQNSLPSKLLPECQANNFVGVKALLRQPPFDSIRKNGLILIRGGEDGPKAKSLLVSYQELIASLEAIDATASLGMRGKKQDPFLLGIQYERIVRALDDFVVVGTEAAAIPLQESSSMQDALRYGSIQSKKLTTAEE